MRETWFEAARVVSMDWVCTCTMVSMCAHDRLKDTAFEPLIGEPTVADTLQKPAYYFIFVIAEYIWLPSVSVTE